ncbi:hypothetical protein KCU93_g1976, partial [Aureobasidium melanogenum]
MLSAIAAVLFLGKNPSRDGQLICCQKNSIFLSTPSSHPVYASVDPDGHPDIYHTFLERPFQPILSRDHREEFSKRSPTVAIRYDEPGQRIIQRFVSVGRGHSATKSTCTHEAESPRRLVFTLTVRFQLESPRATISSSYSEGKNCLRCEDMLEKVNLPCVSVGRSGLLFASLSLLPRISSQSAVGLAVACTPWPGDQPASE